MNKFILSLFFWWPDTERTSLEKLWKQKCLKKNKRPILTLSRPVSQFAYLPFNTNPILVNRQELSDGTTRLNRTPLPWPWLSATWCVVLPLGCSSVARSIVGPLGAVNPLQLALVSTFSSTMSVSPFLMPKFSKRSPSFLLTIDGGKPMRICRFGAAICVSLDRWHFKSLSVLCRLKLSSLRICWPDLDLILSASVVIVWLWTYKLSEQNV